MKVEIDAKVLNFLIGVAYASIDDYWRSTEDDYTTPSAEQRLLDKADRVLADAIGMTVEEMNAADPKSIKERLS